MAWRTATLDIVTDGADVDNDDKDDVNPLPLLPVTLSLMVPASAYPCALTEAFNSRVRVSSVEQEGPGGPYTSANERAAL